MRDDTERLHDMLEAIAQIERYASQGQEAFRTDELIQVWIVHHLQIVGEAAASLSEEFQAQQADVPWPVIIAFRNILVHEYFRIDLDTVWRIVERDLPELKRSVEEILSGGQR